MEKTQKILFIYFPIIVLSLIFTEKSYAYIDPGSGSSLLQLIICAVLGGFFALKFFLVKFKSKLKSKFSKTNSDDKNAKS